MCAQYNKQEEKKFEEVEKEYEEVAELAKEEEVELRWVSSMYVFMLDIWHVPFSNSVYILHCYKVYWKVWRDWVQRSEILSSIWIGHVGCYT